MNENAENELPPQAPFPRTRQPRALLNVLRNLGLLIILLAVIVASFMVSYRLGKYVLMPVRKAGPTIEVKVDHPASLEAAREKLNAVMNQALDKQAEKMPVVKAEQKSPVTSSNIKQHQATSSNINKRLATSRYYKLQAGLFVDKNKAVKLAKIMAENGVDNFVKKVKAGWRVQAGAFKTKAEAENAQQDIQAKGFQSVLVYE